ncbi:MAG: head-tail connector protein [Telluria sp.]
MRTRLLAPAVALAVSLESAKKNLRIAGNRQDDLVEMWIRGVTRHAEEYMQRSLMTQTWSLTLDAFTSAIKLRMPPVASVVHIKFADADNVVRTLDPADYVVDQVSEPGYVVPAPGRAWPATYPRINAVECVYTTGYGADASMTPPDITLYLLAKLREQFDPATKPEKETVHSTFIDSLLDHHRIWD